MFGRIARRYDLLNHLLSFNLDRRWRRAAARELAPEPGQRLLDLCGGTGDLTLELSSHGRPDLVVCCDFSHPMLTLAAEKFRRRGLSRGCLVLEADGLKLPFPDASFDGVTAAFGVRNLENLETGLREIHRVLRPGGRFVILEFSTPTAPVLSGLYRLYLDRLLPRIGDGISGKAGPYGYLARTIGDFPDQAALAGRIRECGFAACGWQNLTGGIVAIHTAFKGPGEHSQGGRRAALG